VREEKDGEGRKKAKESRVVPHPKLNPGTAKLQNFYGTNTHPRNLGVSTKQHWMAVDIGYVYKY